MSQSEIKTSLLQKQIQSTRHKTRGHVSCALIRDLLIIRTPPHSCSQEVRKKLRLLKLLFLFTFWSTCETGSVLLRSRRRRSCTCHHLFRLLSCNTTAADCSFNQSDVFRDSLSSSVLCSTARVRTFTFSGWVRGRLGVMRLTAAVLRKRLARPRVGELNQLGLARAPPIAAAPNGLCRQKHTDEEETLSVLNTQLQLHTPTGLNVVSNVLCC